MYKNANELIKILTNKFCNKLCYTLLQGLLQAVTIDTQALLQFCNIVT